MTDTVPPTGAPDSSAAAPGGPEKPRGAWTFQAPGHKLLAEQAEQEKQAREAALEAEPGSGPGTYEDRAEMLPHPFSWAFKAVHMGPNLPPLNLPHELLHFLAWQIDRLGFRHHEEYQLEFYEDPPGQNVSINPGTWVPREEYFATRARKAASPDELVEPEPPLPDLTDMPADKLAAMEQAIRQEKIRQAKIEQADIQAKVAMGVAEMPELPTFNRRRTPPPPRPQTGRPTGGQR